ncbi:hypothetical protein E4K72_03700 [Oxalobacteraceae bacterium OM1]|nr:hypothetical protein E4K72_03700 [Oxalobacteraceae bacterium OM1]
MTQSHTADVNALVARFTELQERWEGNPDQFSWEALQELASAGAHAYNDEAGPSFHALVLDGVPHTAFHERFVRFSLDAGFDPFRLGTAGATQSTVRALLDHAALAQAAASNPASARMHAMFLEQARQRFGPMVEQARAGNADAMESLQPVFTACAESIPSELLAVVVPELARAHGGGAGGPFPGEEGYLSAAESAIDSARPQG